MLTLKNTTIPYLILVLITFMFTSSVHAQNTTVEKKAFIKIEIKGMACPYCAYGMEKALKEVSGVENVTIELEEGMAYIITPLKQKPTKKSLAKIVTDSGFTVGTIEFSDLPFKHAIIKN